VPEQTLTMAIGGDLSGGLSNAATGLDTPRIASFLFDGLYGLDEHLAPAPRLAASLATVSADGTLWTVRLRSGVTFHDGTELTADDVVSTYDIARSPNCRFGRSLCAGDVLAAVNKVDDQTVAFTLREPLASFATTYLGMWIESSAVVEASYARFRDGIDAVSAAETTTFLDDVATEEGSPTGAAGEDAGPTVDYGRFRADGEALLTKAGVALPNEATYKADGALDVDAYVRDIVARVRAVDATFTARPVDALAAAYPYLDMQVQPIGTGPFRLAGSIVGCAKPAAPPAPAKTPAAAGGASSASSDDGDARDTPVDADSVAAVGVEKHVCRGLNACKNQGGSGENDCAGQGSCATVERHGCSGKNACKGQGGCGQTAVQNQCAGKGGCGLPLMDSAWDSARKIFEAKMKKQEKEIGAAPAKP
jgi:hypothetical protein